MDLPQVRPCLTCCKRMDSVRALVRGFLLAGSPFQPSRKDKPLSDPSKSDLDALQQRIDAKREAHEDKTEDAPRSAWSLGMRYGSEFFAGVLVGAGLGFLVDFVAGIGPWGLMIGTMFGFASGTLNVVRAAREINSEMSGQSDDSVG